ncbi:hypothetical protein ACLBXM_09970 [Xanthobacteraceae bacterium A53D]
MDIFHSRAPETQDAEARAFVGGVPTLPPDLAWPTSGDSGTDLTFFFQIKLLEGPWAGRIIAVFLDTTAYADDDIIPKMPAPMAGADLTAAFFADYERFFRILVLDDAGLAPRTGAPAPVAFHVLRTGAAGGDDVAFGSIGEAPSWVLEDEGPASFAGNPQAVHFLFQTALDYEFETVEGAPRQKVANFYGGDGPMDSNSPNYMLFATNAGYYFGIDTGSGPQVYVVPQS